MELYEGQFKKYKFNTKTYYKKEKDDEGHHIKVKKCYDIFTFDIEVSSGYIEDGKVIGYVPGKPEEYWNSLQKVALCYIWQFSCNDKVYYGRELKDFLLLLDDLPEAQMKCFIHNLSYEFCFLLNILHVEEVFARTPQHPMKAVFKEYPHIEFRCSYILTNMSLANWGKDLGVDKKIGQLDYHKLYTPYSDLNDEELEYCEYDCIIVYEGIKQLLNEYKTVFKLPLTSTGRIRKVFKGMLTKDRNYMLQVKRRIPSVKEFEMLQHIYAGGWTHPNRLWANRVVKGHIEHYDFTSSYPYSLTLPYYPCSRFFYDFKKELPTEEELNSKCWMMDIELFDVKPTTFHSYLQNSKCEVRNAIYDNGRIAAADYVRIKVTEFDWFIIRELYEYSSINVINRYYARKGYLNEMIIRYILQLYSNKTVYKGLPEYEEQYRLSKTYVNGVYGMFVTSPVSADVIFDGEEWHIKPLKRADVEEKFKKLKDFRDSQTGYFLDYSIGVWCTSISRYNLARCILGANDGKNKGRNVLYYDTDSCFIYGKSDYSWYNKEVDEHHKALCEHFNIPYEMVSPKDKKGIEHTLGYFEPEENDIEFVSCHAKCYCERHEDGTLAMTISGINKSAVKQLNDDIYNFKDGMEFDKDDETSKKNLHTYLHDLPAVTYPDGYHSEYVHGIHMRPTGYRIGVTDEYDRLNNFSYNYSQLPQHSIIRLRNIFV